MPVSPDFDLQAVIANSMVVQSEEYRYGARLSPLVRPDVVADIAAQFRDFQTCTPSEAVKALPALHERFGHFGVYLAMRVRAREKYNLDTLRSDLGTMDAETLFSQIRASGIFSPKVTARRFFYGARQSDESNHATYEALISLDQGELVLSYPQRKVGLDSFVSLESFAPFGPDWPVSNKIRIEEPTITHLLTVTYNDKRGLIQAHERATIELPAYGHNAGIDSLHTTLNFEYSQENEDGVTRLAGFERAFELLTPPAGE